MVLWDGVLGKGGAYAGPSHCTADEQSCNQRCVCEILSSHR